MDRVTAISIDLDDTLWPIAPVIERAEQALHDWFVRNCPGLPLDKDNHFGVLRREVLDRHPERSHDFAFLRRAGIAMLLERGGYRSSLVDAAYDAFFRARNQVELFDDVVPALEKLRGRYLLLAVTNGNADLGSIGLDEFFAHTIRAADVGAAKPSAAIFDAAVEAAGVAPDRVVHIGDAPHEDVHGARMAGLHAVWINRFQRVWPDGRTPPAAEIADLHQLDRLLPPA